MDKLIQQYKDVITTKGSQQNIESQALYERRCYPKVSQAKTTPIGSKS